MTTRREYAISLGLATPGRGRMSRDAHVAIEKAEAEGMVFSDPKPVTKAEKIKARESTRPAPRKPVVQKPVQENAVVERKPFTGKFEAIMPDGKRKALSERTACQCGASLCYCLCATPKVGLLIVDPTADDTEAYVEIAKV